jgi:hypothetical protein
MLASAQLYVSKDSRYSVAHYLAEDVRDDGVNIQDDRRNDLFIHMAIVAVAIQKLAAERKMSVQDYVAAVTNTKEEIKEEQKDEV